MTSLNHVSSIAWLLFTVAAACTFENGTDFAGNDLSRTSASSPEECCAACVAHASDGCLFWTFMPGSTCYMKVSDAGRRHAGDPGVPGRIATYTSGSIKGSPTPAPPAPPAPFSCKDDFDCSLAGSCVKSQCVCDAWASGADCSYLNFAPVDRASGLGYIDPKHSSWGGNAVLGSDGQWHLYMAEIACDSKDSGTRCGLGGWGSHSQVAHAVSKAPEGPYVRKELTFGQEHHNPTLIVSPVDKSWNIYSIRATSGPIVMSRSTDEGKTWTSSTPGTQVSTEQNPGPVLFKNGSMTMFYRSHANLPKPTCSGESIGVQYCSNSTSVCSGGRNPIFKHTAEDPSVFIDKRGNWHMLVNALPGGCNPKTHQGGHAWSRDGITWSEPRVGAYNTTVLFTDGTSMTCTRRERPQMVLDADGIPLVMFAGVVGCPTIPNTPYKGGGDCFTLAQKMNRPASQAQTFQI